MVVKFRAPVPMSPNCYVRVTFPTELSVTTITTVETLGLFGALSTVSSPTIDGTANTVSFTKCPSYTDNTLEGYVYFTSITIPSYTMPTGSI